MTKVVLVTGASSGMGREMVKELLKKNYVVYGASRRVDKMEELVRLGAKTIPLDLTKDTSLCDCVHRIIKNEGKIDILINNAGYGAYGALEDVPIEEARRQFEVNVFGLARLIQLVIPGMRKNHSGKIINISSVGGRLGEPHGAWYHATKFAVEGLSDCIRPELKRFNVDVVVVQPGAIKTDWFKIARENLIKISGDGPYGAMVRKHERLLASQEKAGSSPEVIARAIVKICLSRNPKPRYIVGKNARLAIFLRRCLTDRLYDKLILSLINRSS